MKTIYDFEADRERECLTIKLTMPSALLREVLDVFDRHNQLERNSRIIAELAGPMGRVQ